MPEPRLIYTDADGLASSGDPALIVLDITRQEVERGNIASVLERLHVMTDSVENIHRYRETLVFQVGGYDGDSRELPEIPEVRTFFHDLIAEWPHWFWFLHRGVGAITLLMSLLCRVRTVRGAGGTFGTEFEDMGELQGTLGDLFDRGNALFDAYGVSDADVAESANSAVNDLLGESAP